jgi:hypothetical protein
MSKLQHIGALLILAACTGPTAQQRAVDAELAALAPIKQTYPVVVGFDVRTPTTLVVSLDLQTYIGMSDDEAAAMKRAVVERWRTAWIGAHPKSQALLHVRFIDFIGRKVGEATTRTVSP